MEHIEVFAVYNLIINTKQCFFVFFKNAQSRWNLVIKKKPCSCKIFHLSVPVTIIIINILVGYCYGNEWKITDNRNKQIIIIIVSFVNCTKYTNIHGVYLHIQIYLVYIFFFFIHKNIHIYICIYTYTWRIFIYTHPTNINCVYLYKQLTKETAIWKSYEKYIATGSFKYDVKNVKNNAWKQISISSS